MVDNESISEKVLSKNSFSLMVEERSLNDNITCLEVIMQLESEGIITYDGILDLLSERLLKKLEIEATNLHLLKKVVISPKSLV